MQLYVHAYQHYACSSSLKLQYRIHVSDICPSSMWIFIGIVFYVGVMISYDYTDLVWAYILFCRGWAGWNVSGMLNLPHLENMGWDFICIIGTYTVAVS